jgi:anti-sigma factor RsiW
MLAMTCRELADFLMDYLDGSLPADVQSAFDRHLALCPNCVAYVKTYRTTIELSRCAYDDDQADAALTEVPPDLVRAILAARKPGPSA